MHKIFLPEIHGLTTLYFKCLIFNHGPGTVRLDTRHLALHTENLRGVWMPNLKMRYLP